MGGRVCDWSGRRSISCYFVDRLNEVIAVLLHNCHEAAVLM
jgi:hypothetical protein